MSPSENRAAFIGMKLKVWDSEVWDSEEKGSEM
jgi:hypothetical protein